MVYLKYYHITDPNKIISFAMENCKGFIAAKIIHEINDDWPDEDNTVELYFSNSKDAVVFELKYDNG